MRDEPERPSPEAMLARLAAEEPSPSGRGRLKVYFGYAAGVGKTYRMLHEAHRLVAEGVDLVVGYVEPHGRPETEALLAGLEQIPCREVDYHGRRLSEFDLDAVLARAPQLVLVDELPHTNTPGLRHTKRWQDIEELLQAGIDVHTTCNVQHVESLNDVIAQISGVTVRETVPDEVFSQAAELALVDLPPDDLLERLREGKVYIPERAEQALRNFFQRGNLVALRELALRTAADQVHADVELARRGQTQSRVWATRERLLVCVGPSPTSAAVIRAARRLADSLSAPWCALHVETEPPNEAARAGLLRNLQLAERLGAETVTAAGVDLVETTLAYAHQHNVTKIVIGSSPPRRWRRETINDRLLRQAGDLDVVVVHGQADLLGPAEAATGGTTSARDWWIMAAAMAAATGFGDLFYSMQLAEANLVMVYLAAVVVVAVCAGRRPAIAASLAAVVLFDVLYIQPRFSLAVSDTQYLFTFLVMLAVGLVIAELTARAQQQAELARREARRTEALYRLARRLTAAADLNAVMTAAEDEVTALCGGRVAVFRRRPEGLRPVLDHPAGFPADPAEVAVAQWVLDHGRPAGRGTDTLPGAEALYLPLPTAQGVAGVLALAHEDPLGLLLPDQRALLEACATQTALALERVSLAREAEAARLSASSEALRSNLLASVSHDLRTPLAAIAGASSTLLQTQQPPPAERQALLETINEEAERLSRLISNLLRLTQLEAGVSPNCEWHPVQDVLGSALRAAGRALGGRPVQVSVQPDMLLGWVDAVLLEQLLINLLDNACRYTPPGSGLELSAELADGALAIALADHGPGLAPGDAERIFETFQRGAGVKSDSRGAGLGLAICRAVATAHGGTLTAQNGPAGGAVFTLRLPQTEAPPSLAFLGEDEPDE